MGSSHKLPSKGKVAVATVKVAGRFVAGRDLRGGRKTDAGFRRRGRTPLTTTGHATRWAHMPHWQRSATRLGGTAATLATTVGLVVDPVAVAATAQVGTWGVGGWAVYAIGDGTYRYSHRRQYIVPLAEVVGPVVGWPSGTPAGNWITVPHGHREDPDKVVHLRLPPSLKLNEGKKREILSLVRPILGMHNADFHFESGAEPYLELRAAPSPPDFVDLARVREKIETTPAGELFIGLAARVRDLRIDLAQDAPHFLCSFGSGAGKSVLGRLLAAQFRRKGGRVIVIDIVKRGASHKWAKDLDGIEVVRSPARGHDVLVALAEEVSNRCELAWTVGEINRTPVLVVFEEANATQRLLQRYWQEELEGKKTSPAVAALADILCVGREAKTHVALFAQQGTAKATGGGDARENFGVRMLSRFTRNTAKMLIPEFAPHFPRSSRHRGRVQVCMDGEAIEAQVVFTTDEEGRELALSGEPAGALTGTLSPVSPAHTPYGDDGDTGTSNVVEFLPRALSPLADEPELAEPDPLVSLAEAADGMVVGETHEALKKARTRARREGEPFPPVRGRAGRTELYRPAELRAWALNRPGPGALAGSRSSGSDAS